MDYGRSENITDREKMFPVVGCKKTYFGALHVSEHHKEDIWRKYLDEAESDLADIHKGLKYSSSTHLTIQYLIINLT